jgi:prophage tail gpP-like protein
MPDINATPTATSRQPRGAIKLNGKIVTGWESWEVDNNAYRAADTFSVVFAVGELPPAYGPVWFATQKEIDCQIYAS